MSWLTGLAGKAEDLLNRVDNVASHALSSSENIQGKVYKTDSNTAAANKVYTPYLSPAPVLTVDNQQTQHQTGPVFSTSKMQTQQQASNMYSTSSLSNSASVPSNLNKINSNQSQTSKSSRQTNNGSLQNSNGTLTPPKSKKDKDEELFEFLNSSNPAEGKKKQRTTPVPGGKPSLGSARHSRQSSTSSSTSTRSGKTPDMSTSVVSTGAESGTTQNPGVEDVDSVDHPGINLQDDLTATNDSSSGYHSSQDDNSSHQQLSSLELENKLLKNEIAALNQEMASVIQRSKDAQHELDKSKRKLNEHEHHLSRSDQIVREMRAQEGDLHEALRAKDSQLAVLRIRFEDAEKELEEKKAILESLHTEKNRILADHTSASGVHSQALDTLKEKFNEAEFNLRREQEAYKMSQEENLDRQARMESEMRSLAESLTTAQKKHNEEKAKSVEIRAQVKSLKTQVDSSKQELCDYKEKATRILQSKDKLISSLKEGNLGTGQDASIFAVELEEARQERDMLRDELQQSRITAENLKTEIGDLEVQIQQDADVSQEQLSSLEDQLLSEKQHRDDADQEVARQKQELRYAHEELLKQKTALQSRIQDREMEIERLRNQLTTKSLSSTSQTELENRLHALTESLIQKQTMLETLSTEKNSLTLQFERLEGQYREAEAAAVRANTTAVVINDHDDVRQRLPGFMRESPQDGNVTRKVKRAAKTIDKFSIRLGRFLRQYPMARVFVIVYMVLLHLWVTVVLLTYKPEMHGTDYHPKPPGEQR